MLLIFVVDFFVCCCLFAFRQLFWSALILLVLARKVGNVSCKATPIGQLFVFSVNRERFIKIEVLEGWEYQDHA